MKTIKEYINVSTTDCIEDWEKLDEWIRKGDVEKLIDDVTLMFEPHNFTALKDFNKELKARITG